MIECDIFIHATALDYILVYKRQCGTVGDLICMLVIHGAYIPKIIFVFEVQCRPRMKCA